MFPWKTKTAGWSNSRLWNIPRQIWPSAWFILHSPVLLSSSWSRPEVASSLFSFGSSQGCFFCANRRAMEQVTTLCYQFAYSGGLQEPTRCLLGIHIRFGWTSVTVYNFFTWFSAICAFMTNIFWLWLWLLEDVFGQSLPPCAYDNSPIWLAVQKELRIVLPTS